MATIYDVASRSGASPATVSRVFNGMNVSAKMTKRVRKAADELGYTPNRTARNLRKKNSEVLALAIPDIENPFFTAVARGVEDVAQAAGYSVVLCNTDEDHVKEARYIDIAISENMAGLILAPAGDHCDLSGLISRGRPVVAVDRSPRGFEVDAVTVDNRAGGRAATQALMDQGYKRIGCISGPVDVETAQLRVDGWRQAVTADSRMTDPDRYLKYANYRVDGGEKAMRDLMRMAEPPDAVFVANNLMSIGALRVLADRGTRPPEIGLASFGDLPYMAEKPDGITIVHLPARHLGATAASMLLERIGGDAQPARTIVLRNHVSVPGDADRSWPEPAR
jgi:LacI family transcriptional regulator